MYICTAEQVDAGEVREKAFFGTRVISEKTYDLCNLQSFWNMSCPLHPGNMKVIYSTLIAVYIFSISSI